MKIYSKTDKAILGIFYPKNVCIEVSESQAQFLIEKEGFEIFKEKQKLHKKKYGGK